VFLPPWEKEKNDGILSLSLGGDLEGLPQTPKGALKGGIALCPLPQTPKGAF